LEKDTIRQSARQHLHSSCLDRESLSGMNIWEEFDFKRSWTEAALHCAHRTEAGLA
jgi:hypothetical protein